MPRSLLSLTTLLLLACPSASTSPSGADAGCSPCGTGQACDPRTGRCATALPVAAACGTLPDGGVIEGACAEGLSCGSVGATLDRCTRDCTAAQGCTEGRTCLARTTAGAPAFCGSLAKVGDHCDAASLIFCTGKAECIAPSADQTSGQCFADCDSSLADPNPDCGSGQSCADLFPTDPTLGICVTPPAPGALCDHSQLEFCGRRQQCVRPTAAMWGYCHPRCTGDSDCPSGQQCLSPVAGVSFCAATVARCPAGASGCATCSGELDLWCARADLCVRLGASTVCKVDCGTLGQSACPSGTTCTALGTSGSSACLP